VGGWPAQRFEADFDPQRIPWGFEILVIFAWLCGLQVISHRGWLSGFRSEHKAALDDLFVQVRGMLSKGLTTPERVTPDGTKIKANAAVIPSAAKRSDAKRDCFTCPSGQILAHHAILNRENREPTHVYRAPKAAFRNCRCVASMLHRPATRVEAIHHAQRRARDYDDVQSQDGDRRGTIAL
jgi:hypothetical protein